MRPLSSRRHRRRSGNSRISGLPTTGELFLSKNLINKGIEFWAGEVQKNSGGIRMRSAILLLCGAVLLSGCISVSGGERTVKEVPGTTTTLGQRLMDLKADYDSGRISEQEYNQRRQRLLQGS